MKYIKDKKAILSEIGMAFFGARVHEVNRFFLSATKKKRNLVEEKKSERYRKLFAKHKFNEQCRPLEMMIAPDTHHVKRFFLFRECCTVFPMAP